MRTRFAPSPTGYIHLGTLRTALFGYLLSRRMQGAFVLRIEDTDQERLVADSAENIYRALDTVGIKYDEGPNVGGPYAPYIQSQRKSGYLQYAEQLVEKGGAYYCFCDKGQTAEVQDSTLDSSQDDSGDTIQSYDRRCYGLSADAVRANLDAKMPYIIRQLIPEGKTTFVDQVFGEITVENTTLDDQVLIKSDGMPTYNFANVVDDHLMKITHVIRGTEFLPSTPKYNLLYQALGWEIPTYVHLPLILREGGGKLSKRHGDAYFEDFLAKGFLPEAIINYIALLGWSPPDNREIYSLTELGQIFNIEGISKSPSVFDINKLRWVNGEYLKAMDFDGFYKLAVGYIDKAVARTDCDRQYLAKLIHGRVSVMDDIAEALDFIDNLPEYDNELFVHKKSKSDTAVAADVLSKIAPLIADFDENSWNGEALYAFMTESAAAWGLKSSQVLWPMRCALSGKPATPGGASDLLAILGKQESLRRVEIALVKLT